MRYLDNIPDASGLAEDEIHLLERAIGSFRIEEVYSWNNSSVTKAMSQYWHHSGKAGNLT